MTLPGVFKSGRVLTAAVATTVLTTLAGCSMPPNSSNPTLTINSAKVRGNRAMLNVKVDNPSSHDVELTGIDYTLIYGPLPVAEGRWSGSRQLKAGAGTDLVLGIPFDSDPLDPSAEDLVLSGVMHLKDLSGAGKMGLTQAAFEAEAKVDH